MTPCIQRLKAGGMAPSLRMLFHGSHYATGGRHGQARPGPGSRLVRQISSSAVLGSPTATAPPSARRRWTKFSAREHSAQVSTCGQVAKLLMQSLQCHNPEIAASYLTNQPSI